MDGPSDRLDQAMNDRRLDLDLSWDEVAAAARRSVATLRSIRRGTSQPGDLTKRRIENVLQWGTGSIDAILAGGDPTPLEEKHEPEPDIADLAERVARIEARGADNRVEEIAEVVSELQAMVNKMLGIDSNKESGNA